VTKQSSAWQPSPLNKAATHLSICVRLIGAAVAFIINFDSIPVNIAI
jgi:hypothetical protein